MMKYANFIILFILLSFVFLFQERIQPSTNMLSLFTSKDSLKKLDIATELGYTKEMMIAVKGFSRESQNTVDELSKQLKLLDGIELVESKTLPSKEIQNYYKKFYHLLSEFSAKEYTKDDVSRKLKELYDKHMGSFFYTPIDKNDPLELFNFDLLESSNLSNKGGYLTLGEYGYLLRVKTNVSPSNMNEAKKLYDDVKQLTSEYKNIIAFAGFFYTVENSTKIKGDITKIVVFSTLLLLLIYLVLIRDFKLLLNTVTALFSSMVFAILVSTLVYDNFHIISIAFGMSITAVSIDYLFHYYFHNFYQNKKRVDKSVLYGYLTTTVAFAIFSFIPVPLIAQISFFTALSLSFAYLVFTFIFPYIESNEFKNEFKKKVGFKSIPAYLISLVSVFLLIYTSFNIKLDNNIRNLDYQNLKLQEIEEIFKTAQKSKFFPVLVEGQSEDSLIKKLHALDENVGETFSLASFVLDKEECVKRKKVLQSYDFKKLNKLLNEEAKKVGFKENYFTNTYDLDIPPCEDIDLNIFSSYNLSVVLKDDSYYTIALVKDPKSALKLEYVHSVDAKTLFERVSQKMYEDISFYSSIVILVILVLIALSVRGRFFYAINYILFPLSFVLAVVVTFYPLNIMHLFSMIILIAIGIDYGIYMSKTNKPSNTMLAIKYSLLSTFAAFGVLIFSTITALNSIGIVITLGVGAIFILIKVMK